MNASEGVSNVKVDMELEDGQTLEQEKENIDTKISIGNTDNNSSANRIRSKSLEVTEDDDDTFDPIKIRISSIMSIRSMGDVVNVEAIDHSKNGKW